MSSGVVVILVEKVFHKPYPIIAGNIIVSPRLIPFKHRFYVYFPNGQTKVVMLHSEITSSSNALKQNLHGYRYSGDILADEDVVDNPLLTNTSYAEALQLYNDYILRL